MAYVLSGGGSLGAVQVGMLQAMTEMGIRPDLLIGTSVGALNAAYIAGHGVEPDALDNLKRLWTGLHRHDVFPFDPARLAEAALGRAPSIFTNSGLRKLIEHHLPFDRLEDAKIPLHVVTTDVASGSEVDLSSGKASRAILASTAIPAIYPSVRIDGKDLMDGGVADNSSVSLAVKLGADAIYVLPTGYTCALDEPPSNPLASAMHALTLLIEQRLILEVATLGDQVDMKVIPPLCPLSVSSTDFRHSKELIKRARQESEKWLNGPGITHDHPEQFLSLHTHHRHGVQSPKSR
ncbi:MAG: patatin-like phospholipase family protein [Microthrixaceae bacterium]